MRLRFDATKDFLNSLKNVDVLIKFAFKESNKNNENNRNLFLKLCLVLLVTRFQVFIEASLKEFDYKIKEVGKKNKRLPDYYRLNILKILTARKPIHKSLENPTTFTRSKLDSFSSQIEVIHSICKDETLIDDNFQMNTKFPLGKNGLNELIDLYKQIEGKDIFENPPFDVNKINEILSRRHNIVHEDKNQQLTEPVIESYKAFLKEVAIYIDGYLKTFTLKKYRP